MQAAVNNPNALGAAFHPAVQSTAHRAVGLRPQLAPHRFKCLQFMCRI